MFNKSVLIGRLTKDPELRKTSSGLSVLHFQLAVNRNYNSNEKQSVDYISCVCWKKLAENISKYCSQGSLILVSGRLQSGSYKNEQGHNVYTMELLCNEVQFLDTKKRNALDSFTQADDILNDKELKEIEKEFDPNSNIM